MAEADTLIALLGRSRDDSEVESALSGYRIRNRPQVRIDEEDADGPVVKTQSWVKNSRLGIEFGFDDEAAWWGRDETEFGKGTMLLTQVCFFGQHQGVRPYAGELPMGLTLLDSRSTVRRKLAAYEPTRHSQVRDTWDLPTCRMTVSYCGGDEAEGIAFVLCMLVEPPLPMLPYALATPPGIEGLLSLFGAALQDSHVQQALGPLGLSNRINEILDSGEADFSLPYGLILNFSAPPGARRRGGKDVLLSAITLLRERELGGRQWPGELPFGLRFEDSPESAERKLGRAPDHQDDEDFVGTATWLMPEVTLTLVYSSMENRVYRFVLTAPGLSA